MPTPESNASEKPPAENLPVEHQALNRVFDALVERFKRKNIQYTGVSDRLFRNFSLVPSAAAGYLNPRQIAWVLAGKHIQLVNDLLFAPADLFDMRGGFDTLEESLGDLAVYVIIILALLRLEREDSYEPGI
jgi:hypothetical protein